MLDEYFGKISLNLDSNGESDFKIFRIFYISFTVYLYLRIKIRMDFCYSNYITHAKLCKNDLSN